ncbi:TIR domain-containing protein [Sinomonas sp. B1-1]|uniref:TIR domain-containing protein n=1 Tax=Sinomonas sp. B1-1 TaxID=3141454 RepID=UPI003D290A2D
MSEEALFALQQCLSSLRGADLDAYFALVRGGPDKLEILSKGKASIAARAQALLRLAREQGTDRLYQISQELLMDYAARKFYIEPAQQQRLLRALGDLDIHYDESRLYVSERKMEGVPHERHTSDPKELDVSSELWSPSPSKRDRRSVFLVQGRNNAVNAALTSYLRSLYLRVHDWEEVVRWTGEPNPYIGEVIRVGMDRVQSVIVLFTPDDHVRLDSTVAGSNTPRRELEEGRQPRPNVLIEAGMALARDPKRTLIVQWGDIRPATDLDGKHLFRLSGPKWRHHLKGRLTAAGLEIDDSSGEWLSAGAFPHEHV